MITQAPLFRVILNEVKNLSEMIDHLCITDPRYDPSLTLRMTMWEALFTVWN